MIVIIDYGMGNLRSILRKFERIKLDAIISSEKNDILKASKLILPGVGHFGQAMNNIHRLDLKSVLDEKVLHEKTPILGICLGMQLLTGYSEEGNIKGLEWIDAITQRFDFSKNEHKLRVPHVGWNNLKLLTSSILLQNIDLSKRFYFTHSYFVKCQQAEYAITETDYGINFHSIIQKDNIYGTQFHPEKSHMYGLNIIKNFVNLS